MVFKMKIVVTVIIMLSIILTTGVVEMSSREDGTTSDILPLLPSKIRTFSAFDVHIPCYVDKGLYYNPAGRNSNDSYGGSNSIDFQIMDDAFNRIHSLNTSGNEHVFWHNDHYRFVPLGYSYTNWETENEPLDYVGYTNNCPICFFSDDVIYYPYFDLFIYENEDTVCIMDSNTLNTLATITKGEHEFATIRCLSKSLVSVDHLDDTGNQTTKMLNLETGEYILPEYEAVLEFAGYGHVDGYLDKILFRDHLVDVETCDLVGIELPEFNSRHTDLWIHDDCYDIFIVESQSMDRIILRFDAEGKHLETINLTELGVYGSYYADITKDYVLHLVPCEDDDCSGLFKGYRVTNLFTGEHYDFTFGDHPGSDVSCKAWIDNEYMYISGCTGSYRKAHFTDEIDNSCLKIQGKSPIFTREDELYVAYPRQFWDRNCVVGYPLSDKLEIDPSRMIDSSWDYDVDSWSEDEVEADRYDDIIDQFGYSFCMDEFIDFGYYAGSFLSNDGDWLQQSIGAWKFIRETSEYVLGLSKQWVYDSKQGGSVCRFDPCPTFSLSRIETEGENKISFEVEMARNDGLSDPLTGQAYLIPWAHHDDQHGESESNKPVFVKIPENKIDINFLESGETQTIVFDLPSSDSMLTQLNLKNYEENGQAIKQQLEYVALIIESNGLLDTASSTLSDENSSKRPLYDGIPTSFDRQASIVLTVWRVE